MIQFGFGDDNVNNFSLPDPELHQSHDFNPMEEEVKSINSKTSTSKYSHSKMMQDYSTIQKSGSYKKFNEIYEKLQKDTSIEKNFNLNTQYNTQEKAREEILISDKFAQGMRGTFGVQIEPYYSN